MRKVPPQRYAALLALGCALLPGTARGYRSQEEGSVTGVLLSRARTLEQRGRLDLAKQDWVQVLTLEPNDVQALAGLVRAARAEGRSAEAAQYLTRLRAAHPHDPELVRLEGTGKAADSEREFAEAERLGKAGDNRSALAIYRRLYGLTPPPGAPALAYYQAESATEDGRPQAIAGLRALADRYPSDTRYAVLLGRVLLASPRTQAEGRTLLERYPGNADAEAALRAGGPGEVRGSELQGKGARALSAPVMARPASKPSPAVPLQANNSQAQELPGQQPRGTDETRRTTASVSGTSASGQTFKFTAAQPPSNRRQAFTAEEQAGFSALNQHRTQDAQQIFQDLLSKDPNSSKALAGLGYVRMLSGDAKGAVLLFEKAQESGDRSLALTRALVSAQYELTLQRAATARQQGDLAGAEDGYTAALRERPNDPDALEGLGGILLQTGHMQEATVVFAKLTQVRPMSPSAWRGLVISRASSGKAEDALAADAHVPADAKAPLEGDPSYQQALATAHGELPKQTARVEPPPAQPAPAPSAATPSVATPRQTNPVPPALPSPSSQASATRPGVAPRPSSSAAQVSSPGGNLVGATPASRAPVPPTSGGITKPATKEPASRPPAPPSAAQVARSGAGKNSPPPGAVGAGAQAGKPSPPSAALVAPPPMLPPARAIAAERTAQGNEALQRGDAARAIDLYRDALRQEPELPDALKGLAQALHAAGRNSEALDTLRQMSPSAHAVLDRDATFQVTVGEIYLATERPQEALHAYARAQAVFASQKLPPPMELVLRLTRLLAARADDGNLYRELAYLDSRPDLNNAQRREVQMVWTQWAVHRARVLAAAGERQRAVTVLNAAAEGFAGNPEVFAAVADGYTGVGLPREAVALYKQHDLTNASAQELEAAIQAGIAAHDYKVAEAWSRAGRERFPADPAMLTTAAELEQARGHEQRAIDLSRQARGLAPVQDPGKVLTAELREAGAGHGWRPENGGQLSVLLSPAEAASTLQGTPDARPFLPSTADPRDNRGDKSEVPLLSGLDETSR